MAAQRAAPTLAALMLESSVHTANAKFVPTDDYAATGVAILRLLPVHAPRGGAAAVLAPVKKPAMSANCAADAISALSTETFMVTYSIAATRDTDLCFPSVVATTDFVSSPQSSVQALQQFLSRP